MSKQLAKKEEVTNDLAVHNPAVWGDMDVSQEDLIIPKLMLMQGLSEMVSDGNAKLGDVVDNSSMEVIGSFDKPFKFVPIKCNKIYIITKKAEGSNDRPEFDRIEPVQGQNYDIKGWVENGIHYIPIYTYQVFGLRPENPTMPAVISFRSTSRMAGKQVFNIMAVLNKRAGLSPAATTVEIGTVKRKNDKGTYAVFTVKTAGRTEPELLAEAATWAPMLNFEHANRAESEDDAY